MAVVAAGVAVAVVVAAVAGVVAAAVVVVSLPPTLLPSVVTVVGRCLAAAPRAVSHVASYCAIPVDSFPFLDFMRNLGRTALSSMS